MEQSSVVLSFHGSRTLKDERVRIIVLEEIRRHTPPYIVTHAEPQGVCEVVREICRAYGIPLKLHFLNFKYLRGAFEQRSKAVLAEGGHAVFIHDGKSKGTSNEIKLAKKMGIACTVHTLEVTRFKSSVGFEIDTEWEVESQALEQSLALDDPLRAIDLSL